MPKISQLELCAPDSQVLGSMDSASFPSEPPDIRNWFSSYANESVAFDSIRDFDVSSGSLLKEEKKTKFEVIQVMEKSCDGLICGKMGSLDGIVKLGDDSDEWAPATDSGSSDHLSLSSAPLDIAHWFSSYEYETPPLDPMDGFTVTDYRERDEDKVCNAENNSRENDNDERDFMNVRENTDLHSHGRIQAVVVKCTGVVNGTHQNNLSGCEDDRNVDRHPMSPKLNELKLERVPQQVLPGQKIQTVNHGSVEEFVKSNEDCKENKAESDSRFIHRASRDLNSFNAERYTGIQDKKYVPELQGMKECAKENIDEECINRNRNPWRRPTSGSTGKENVGTSFPGNGFVSTRKGIRLALAHAENLTRPQGIQFDCPVKDVEHAMKHEKNANISRPVLSEATNFHVPNSPEIPGKWKCPQRKRANLGPPLKQVRLDQWVRRL